MVSKVDVKVKRAKGLVSQVQVKLMPEGIVRIFSIPGGFVTEKVARQEIVFFLLSEQMSVEVLKRIYAGFHRSRETLYADLNELQEKGRIRKVKRGVYVSENPLSPLLAKLSSASSLGYGFGPCSAGVNVYYVPRLRLRLGCPPSEGLREIGERIRDDYLLTILLATFLGDPYGMFPFQLIPLTQIKGDKEVADQYIEGFQRILKGELVVAFVLNLDEMFDWLKTEEGKQHLKKALGDIGWFRSFVDWVETALRTLARPDYAIGAPSKDLDGPPLLGLRAEEYLSDLVKVGLLAIDEANDPPLYRLTINGWNYFKRFSENSFSP